MANLNYVVNWTGITDVKYYKIRLLRLPPAELMVGLLGMFSKVEI